MTRKLSVLFVLAFFVMSLGSAAFAASAKKASHRSSVGGETFAPAIVTLSDNDGSSAATSGKPTVTQPTALGYYMAGDVTVGTTDFDWQSNTGRQQRQVVIGSDNRLHTVWMYRSITDEDHKRSIFYSGYIPGVLDPSSAWFISPIPGNGGYGTIAVGPGDSLAVATYHYLKQATGHTYDARFRMSISRQGGVFSYTFPTFDYPSWDSLMPKILTCQGIKTGLDTLEGGYMWPSIAADNNGTATIAHVLAKESAPSYVSGTVTTYVDTTGKASLVYYKTLPNAGAPPSTGACGFLLDSISSNMCYDIVASPVSNKVAAVYLYPKVWTGYDVGDNDDVVYRESNNLGGDWGPRTTVRALDNKDSIYSSGVNTFERPEEVSALYDDNDCLHVLYETYWGGVNSADGKHYYLYLPCRLYHWSSCNPTCNVLLKDGRAKEDKLADSPGAWYSDAGHPPLGRHLFSKISLTQCNVSGAKRLYAVYTLYPDSSGIEGNTHSDRSTTPILNGDIVVQGSTDITGSLWGPVKNISNTRSDGCTSSLGNCFSEEYTNAAPYTNDSMRIQYLLDKDAGSAYQGSSTNPQGVLTDNPMIIKTYQCYAVDLEAILSVTPTEIRYPFHAKKNASLTQALSLINEGNEPANWTSAVVGSAPITLLPASGSVPAGCTNSTAITATIGPKGTEGLFQSTITFSYQVGKTLQVPVDFYVFDSWFLPQDVAIRTANNKMMVNQAGQAANDVSHSSFTYFASPDTDFITDASLIMGTSADNLSWLIFTNGQGDPTVANPFGRLYALSNTTYDTTTFQSYRVAYGKGTNRDSTVGFDVNWYAAKFVDSADFYIGHFEVYKGKNSPNGTVTGLDIAFGCDWDVPSDTSSDNTIGTDPARQMIYLQGEYSATRELGYGASAAYLEKTVSPDSADANETLEPIVGGFAWGNNQQVYGQSGYLADSVWKYVEATTNYNSLWSEGDSIGDMSIVMVIAKNYTVTPTSRLKFDVVLAAKRAQTNLEGLAGLNATVDQAKAFLSNRGRCSACGDANSDGSVDISDVVYLIAHIFSGGTSPRWCDYPKGKGDANGDRQVDISDAVYLIARIFSGGKAPHCQGK
jgi:hypothetical protein